MQATIEKVSSLERRLNVSLPMQEIDAEVENRLKRLARNVRMHGFRPARFRSVWSAAIRWAGASGGVGRCAAETFGEAVRSQNLRVAGLPRFEPKPVEGDNVEFSATFEIYPEIEHGDVSQASIERPMVSVGEPEVDKTIEILRKQRVAYRPVERGAQDGDRITIDFTGTYEDKEFEGGSGKDHTTILGEGRLLADFEKAVVGLKAGESSTFELTFPEDYYGKDMAGKTARFSVTVNRVEEPVFPAVDAEFAKQLGIGDGDIGKMRADIKANLEREVRRRTQARVKDQVMKTLLENAKLDLPNALVGMEVDRLMAGMRQDLAGPRPQSRRNPDAARSIRARGAQARGTGSHRRGSGTPTQSASQAGTDQDGRQGLRRQLRTPRGGRALVLSIGRSAA
jgi:trigger factor